MHVYYQDDAVTLYQGDCRDVLPTLPRVDHVMTDPPYSDDTHDNARSGNGNRGETFITFSSMTVDTLRAVLGTCRARRWAVLTVDWQHVLPLKQAPPSGWRFVRHGVWIKPNPTPMFSGDRPGHGWEAVAILHAVGDDAIKMRWNNGGHAGVWIHPKIQAGHPTQKPEVFLQTLVLDFTDPGDVILDPFAGAGTTLVAAKRLGRRAIGIEIDPWYCELTATRLAQGSLAEMFALDDARARDWGEVKP